MLNDQQINEIHRLHWHQKWSLRQITHHLNLNRRTVAKYLIHPAQPRPQPQRTSKLEPFHAAIGELLEQDPSASAVVILQRLRGRGFDGGISILKDYLHKVRTESAARRAYVRIESPPGDRFEVDWGHFGALDYSGDARKLYAFSLVECHSRMMYVEFTHSQCFETFVRCHVHAFQSLGGVARHLVYDNLATAVAEHEGNLVRFHPRFLAFAREFGFLPRACHVASPWEKGKVERAGIGYLRQNFWPLRTFTDLTDVNRQVRQWLDEIANQRLHRETRERPDQRFTAESLLPVPALLPDYRDSTDALVRKDLRLEFDSNRYCVPARYVGSRLTVKADSQSLTIYDQHREVFTYPRCWRRGQTLGAERFEKELLDQRPAAHLSRTQQRLVTQLGARAAEYLRNLADQSDRAVPRQIAELNELVRQYGPEAVAQAIHKAAAARAFGSDYIANILRQQSSPRPVEPPVRLKDPRLNELTTDQLSLLDYDALLLEDPEKEKS
jgi:transposase